MSSCVCVFVFFQPLVKSVGGVPVADLPAEASPSAQLPPASLDIAAERERLRTVVDKEDKARWRERIREKHRAERKQAKEARKAEKQQQGAAQLGSGDEDDEEVCLFQITLQLID